MIRAVAFDLWETLITDTPELSKRQERLRLDRMQEILRAAGHGHLADRVEPAYRGLWHRCLELYWSADRDIPCRTQIEHFLDHLGLAAGTLDEEALDALEQAYAWAAVEIPPQPVPGAVDLLHALRARGLRIGLISNTGRTPGIALRQVLSDLGLGAAIDAMVFSNEHGECKPLPSIFARLSEALAVDPARTVFVGDNLFVDVHGAQRFGMRAIHFDPPQRGTAVAPPVEHGLTIEPDARVTSLGEILHVISGW